MTNQILLNRVLIKAPGFYRTFRNADGQTALRYDIGSLVHVVEELVSLSACEIALTKRGSLLAPLEHLSPILRERVRILDAEGETDREVAAFLAPILDEYGFVQHGDGMLARPHSLPPLKPEVHRAFGYLFPSLYDLLLSARNNAQLDLDLNRFRASVATLRTESRGSTARAHLAVLEGVLAVYEPTSVPSLLIPRADAEEQERRFKYLVEDLEYRSLSEGAALLGIPADAQRAVRLMKRALDAVLRSPVLSWGAKSAVKTLAAAKGAPAVDLDSAALNGPLKYLPPVVSLDAAYEAALKQWLATREPAEKTGRFGRLLREGFTEVVDAPQPTLDSFQGAPPSSFVRPEDDL